MTEGAPRNAMHTLSLRCYTWNGTCRRWNGREPVAPSHSTSPYRPPASLLARVRVVGVSHRRERTLCSTRGRIGIGLLLSLPVIQTARNRRLVFRRKKQWETGAFVVVPGFEILEEEDVLLVDDIGERYCGLRRLVVASANDVVRRRRCRPVSTDQLRLGDDELILIIRHDRLAEADVVGSRRPGDRRDLRH